MLWIGLAWLLWRTRVPGGLEVPETRLRDHFTAVELHDTARYEGFLRVNRVLGAIVPLLALAALARRAPRLAGTIALGRVGTAVVLGAVTLSVLWAVALPFALASWWWRHRHGLLTQDVFHAVIVTSWEALAGDVVGGLAFVVLVVTLATRFPRGWWALVAPVFVLASVVVVAAQLLLVPLGTHPLRDAKLLEQARALARLEAAPGTRVDVERVSTSTPQANAYAYKLGPLRRVVLWDTLLDGRFTDGEVRVVVAHELAHVGRNHVLKWLAWFVLASVPAWWMIARAAARRGGAGEPANVPYLVLVAAVIVIALTPFGNAVSRRYETEADWIALEATRDPASARTLYARFSRTSLAQPRPPTWAYLFFEDHPTLAQRIGMAEVFATRSSRGSASPASP